MKMHRSECQACHVCILCYQEFVCFHWFSLCGAGIGHQSPLGHDILQEDCFYHTTLDGLVSNPSAGNQQGTRLTKRRISHTDTCRVVYSALHGNPRQLSPRFPFWFPGETTGFFRLIFTVFALHRFLFLSAPKISGHAVVGLISKNW